VEVRVGRALDLLPRLQAEGCEPFDFVFIDADKANIPAYFEWTLKLSRPGSVIVVDNVIRNGRVIDTSGGDPNVEGVRRFNQMLAQLEHVSATTVQTVGSKGYDGFTLAVVRSP
jgi:predicted O-methyltransferase YrrM